MSSVMPTVGEEKAMARVKDDAALRGQRTGGEAK